MSRRLYYYDGKIRPRYLLCKSETGCVKYAVHFKQKFNGLKPSRLWKVNDYLDVIHGNIVCVRSDNDGNFVSIQDEDIAVIKECLVAIKGIHNVDGNIVIVTVPDEYLEEWG